MIEVVADFKCAWINVFTRAMGQTFIVVYKQERVSMFAKKTSAPRGVLVFPARCSGSSSPSSAAYFRCGVR